MKKEKLNQIVSIFIAALPVALFLFEAVLIYLDFDMFRPSDGFGWKPTNRVALVGGLLTCYVGFVLGLSYFFHKRIGILAVVNNLTAPDQKNVLLILGVMCIVLGLWVFLVALVGGHGAN